MLRGLEHPMINITLLTDLFQPPPFWDSGILGFCSVARARYPPPPSEKLGRLLFFPFHPEKNKPGRGHRQRVLKPQERLRESPCVMFPGFIKGLLNPKLPPENEPPTQPREAGGNRRPSAAITGFNSSTLRGESASLTVCKLI